MKSHCVDYTNEEIKILDKYVQIDESKILKVKNYRKKKKQQICFWSAIFFISIVILGNMVEFNALKIIKGFPSMGQLIKRMLVPNFKYIHEIAPALIDTLKMALVASVIGMTLAVPFSLFMSKNINPFKKLALVFQIIFSVLRTIPSLIWAAILVSLFSVGVFSGIMALMISSFLISNKLLRESIEAINLNTIASIQSVGAGKIALVRKGILPMIKMKIITIFFLSIETNIRNATVLGLVGAGGIGQLLWRDLNHLRYDNIAMIILILFLTIMSTDLLCGGVRNFLSNYQWKGTEIRGYRKYKIKINIFKILAFIGFIYSLKTFFAVDSQRLAIGMKQASQMINRMINIDLTYAPKVVLGLIESAGIAVFATIVGGLLAWLFSFFTASNIAPSKSLCFVFKGIANILRTFPPIVMAIIFFRGVGAGPLAGALALSLYTAGVLLKMYSEYLEHIPEALSHGILSTGCKSQINFLKCIWPNTSNQFWSLLFYRLESNIRSSTVLGIIGAGGIGSLITNNIMWRNWERVGILILGCSLLIISVDFLSSLIRNKIEF